MTRKRPVLDFFANTFFCILWLWVAFVSSVDNYLVVKFRSDMPHEEQNPVARFIMHLDDWDVSTFVGIKMFCTILVLGILAIIYNRSRFSGLKYAIILSLFQAALFYYLIWM
jgi:hypothetical protein